MFTWLYFKRLQKNFNSFICTIERFREGDYEARFDARVPNELHSIMLAFNSLADRLHRNIQELKQSEDERKDFIANISHDLRTPLSVAKGYTETLLLQGKLNPQAIEHLQLVEHKIQVVENLVMQLFELSKLESVEFKAQREPFVIAEVMKEIVTSWVLPAEAKHIKLECLGCEGSYMIFADVSMLEKVIRNLMGNAVSYTPENGFIKVELHKKSTDLILQFSNSGPKVPADLIEWINRTDKGSGILKRPARSGLGLAIVKRILELHDYEFAITTNRHNQFTIRMKLYSN
ncbi:GHKL domain-containing protein [Mucilaginibacter terrigena]|uniref:histidine kinase n=1 Tax=Mucilaginibacter terrigena TaxID=2492395 RepID=A0A4Q5LL81_9SPHI|nr:HAMP domain-containing sensor histidine kinase [Mucilaginibacter terrigena]RYU89600.1 GHKL domain-containing protein [Mucilaginibacter terrigena]